MAVLSACCLVGDSFFYRSTPCYNSVCIPASTDQTVPRQSCGSTVGFNLTQRTFNLTQRTYLLLHVDVLFGHHTNPCSLLFDLRGTGGVLLEFAHFTEQHIFLLQGVTHGLFLLFPLFLLRDDRVVQLPASPTDPATNGTTNSANSAASAGRTTIVTNTTEGQTSSNYMFTRCTTTLLLYAWLHSCTSTH